MSNLGKGNGAFRGKGGRFVSIVLALAAVSSALVSPAMAKSYAARLVDGHHQPPPAVQPRATRRGLPPVGCRLEPTPAEEFRNLKQFIDQNSRIINVQELNNQLFERLSPSEKFRLKKELSDRDLRERQLLQNQLPEPKRDMTQSDWEGTGSGGMNSTSENEENAAPPKQSIPPLPSQPST